MHRFHSRIKHFPFNMCLFTMKLLQNGAQDVSHWLDNIFMEYTSSYLTHKLLFWFVLKYVLLIYDLRPKLINITW